MKTETEPKVQKLESLDLLSEGDLANVMLIHNKNNPNNAEVDIGYCDMIQRGRRDLVRMIVPHPKDNRILCQYISFTSYLALERGCVCFREDKTRITHTPYTSIDYQELRSKLKNAGLSN